MNRQRSRRACLVTTVVTLAALSACTQPDEGGTTRGRSSLGIRYFAASAAGAFLIDGNQAFTVAKPGAKAQTAPCCETEVPEPSQRPYGGSVALDGTPWVILGDESVMDLNGKEHGAAKTVRHLTGLVTGRRPAVDGKPARSVRFLRVINRRGVSVLDPTSILVATENLPRLDYDSVVYRVSGSTSEAAAGRPGNGASNPISALPMGQHSPATEVDLEPIHAVVALDMSSFVVFMTAPNTPDDALGGKLQAALVKDGQISRLRLPVLCADQDKVVASRLSDHEVILNATPGSTYCGSPDRQWTRIDTANSTFTKVGSGKGFAGIAGNQLLTAITSLRGDGFLAEVRWQALPAAPVSPTNGP